MELMCEFASKKIIPVIRSMLAKIMYFEFKMRQEEIAKKLFISQPAVSQYLKEKRGKFFKLIEKNEKIKKVIRKNAFVIAKMDVDKKTLQKIFCEICKIVQKEVDIE